MRIFQGEGGTVVENELLGDFLFSGLRTAPAGNARIEIIFDVNVEGILTMSARDLDTGKQMKTTVRVTQH
jgi:molecular chaperone DnaK